MSRGLGTKQLLLLKAIRSIELEREDERSLWSISGILERAYSLSTDMQDVERRRDEASAVRAAHVDRLAREGDKRALLLKAIDRGLVRQSRWEVGERYKRRTPEWVEHHLNPSRTLALLEKRGLIQRERGYAGLTETGRAKCRT
ncbi:hypothetical protein LB557_24640 [Mesorhizobium sp. BR115XR7A]|uniref:hypothetical protein n=1 Tax=Mesorhizobium sp. BR115XR7A TaxID=2876645 RepID=UPI001CCAB225|nr:hypothetical protein [Mesorhizobium sp. BR115XR7A]MBZ9909202.1 hypothetical protein [Mesorhizobium sp. BR115XR7A]MBZ9930450.1 hypothetical protein [Mesorhizobium sp. BR1-1-5]